MHRAGRIKKNILLHPSDFQSAFITSNSNTLKEILLKRKVFYYIEIEYRKHDSKGKQSIIPLVNY